MAVRIAMTFLSVIIKKSLVLDGYPIGVSHLLLLLVKYTVLRTVLV